MKVNVYLKMCEFCTEFEIAILAQTHCHVSITHSIPGIASGGSLPVASIISLKLSEL